MLRENFILFYLNIEDFDIDITIIDYYFIWEINWSLVVAAHIGYKY